MGTKFSQLTKAERVSTHHPALHIHTNTYTHKMAHQFGLDQLAGRQDIRRDSNESTGSNAGSPSPYRISFFGAQKPPKPAGPPPKRTPSPSPNPDRDAEADFVLDGRDTESEDSDTGKGYGISFGERGGDTLTPNSTTPNNGTLTAASPYAARLASFDRPRISRGASDIGTRRCSLCDSRLFPYEVTGGYGSLRHQRPMLVRLVLPIVMCERCLRYILTSEKCFITMGVVALPRIKRTPFPSLAGMANLDPRSRVVANVGATSIASATAAVEAAATAVVTAAVAAASKPKKGRSRSRSNSRTESSPAPKSVADSSLALKQNTGDATGSRRVSTGSTKPPPPPFPKTRSTPPRPVSQRSVTCPRCSTQLRVPKGAERTGFRCGKCNAALLVPKPLPSSSPQPKQVSHQRPHAGSSDGDDTDNGYASGRFRFGSNGSGVVYNADGSIQSKPPRPKMPPPPRPSAVSGATKTPPKTPEASPRSPRPNSGRHLNGSQSRPTSSGASSVDSRVSVGSNRRRSTSGSRTKPDAHWIRSNRERVQ